MGKIWERLSSRTPKRAVKIQKLIGCELFNQNPLLDYVPLSGGLRGDCEDEIARFWLVMAEVEDASTRPWTSKYLAKTVV
jgi:hypothetical protein